MNHTEPRIEPLPRELWTDATKTALRAAVPSSVADRYLSTGDDSMQVPNAFLTIVHNAPLATAFFPHNQTLLRHGVLPARWRELVVLRVAWRTKCQYEWAQHARPAARINIPAEQVAAVPVGATSPLFSPFEAILFSATDQLIAGYQIDDDTWRELMKELDASQLVELAFVVGTFVCVAMVLRSLGVQLDDDIRDVVLPKGWAEAAGDDTRR